MREDSIDLRSDTVTKPTEEMREAMRDAKVGDDVHREDPTVVELENLAAEKLGKESGLFVSSGTQGNITSILTHANRGEELIIGEKSHIYNYEVGGYSSLAGLSPKVLSDKRGYMKISDIRNSISKGSVHHPDTTLICMENTHNKAGGIPLDLGYIKKVENLTEEIDAKFHLDGARIFNAAIGLDEDVKRLVKPFDSIQFCLSKGLSAPIGSLIVGSDEFIERARKNRKKLGGGMRQVGVIAAPGIIALEKMVDRLDEDHKNANKLAKGFKDLGFEIDPNKFKTNIVMLDTSSIEHSAEEFKSLLSEEGVLTLALSKEKIRFVTHRGISEDDIDNTLNIIESLL